MEINHLNKTMIKKSVIEKKVIEEADRYFERNRNAITDEDEAAYNAKIAVDFLKHFYRTDSGDNRTILEIGCNYGYNLNYITKELNADCYGIEPSGKAVDYGLVRWNALKDKVHIEQGISNSLPFADRMFDVVLAGFLLYVTPREILIDSIREMDRVLKQGGFLILTDFDTPIHYERVNKHNSEMPVFKEDYSKVFQSIGYTLVEKHSYSHNSDTFSEDIQERVSTQILYKEKYENMYIKS